MSSYPLPPSDDVRGILDENRPISPEEENLFPPVSPQEDNIDEEQEQSTEKVLR